MLWIQKLKPAWGGSNFTQKNKILDTFADIVVYHVLRCINSIDAIMQQDGTRLSLANIHKALKRSNVKPIKKLKRDKKFKRYQRPVPSDRVQIDTCKIASGIYQYNAVDDCSRWRVMELYKRRSATNTLDFIDVMIVEHSQQTDLREFYANTDLSNFETLKNQLKEWQFSYNYQRLHGFLKGKTPAQYSRELGDKTPL